VLEKANNKPFEFPVKWGLDLQIRMSAILLKNTRQAKDHQPTIPKIQPSRAVNEDNKTVAAGCSFWSQIGGEIIGEASAKNG